MRLISRAVNELIEAGLLAVAHGAKRGSQRPLNRYRLTFLGTLNGPPTWRNAENTENADLSKMPPKMPDQKKIRSPPESAVALPAKSAVATPIYYPQKVQWWGLFLPPEDTVSIISCPSVRPFGLSAASVAPSASKLFMPLEMGGRPILS